MGVLTMHSLEEAHEPEELAQETIIENLDPQEAARLSKVRNIGIAVRPSNSIHGISMTC
jgi:hypothetical protein